MTPRCSLSARQPLLTRDPAHSASQNSSSCQSKVRNANAGLGDAPSRRVRARGTRKSSGAAEQHLLRWTADASHIKKDCGLQHAQPNLP
eukprot:CAMPEP_0115131496 /NCGR_PEP_ID=MMETSP0227-20121206/53160_1 /TAXON_ID=89957 /ORGANISM="Polarella glacialis, Strain CCMP 1383" /LENGTH=88 /DNA_ID=CAMNT_0002537045 /DNA_START=483 /DNA_END=746 /DNA_ORIENTATION=+